MGKKWTPEEDEILRKQFPNCYTAELCKILKRGYGSVCSRARNLGVKKSEDFNKMELQKQGDRLRELGKKSRYVKGMVPLNKGKKMSESTYEKVKNSFFPKGHLPHNTQQDFDINQRVDKRGVAYLFIRVSLDRWVPLQRYVWQKANGKIPAKAKIVFKDGNTLNCDVNNLECLTPAELMQRNSFRNYPAPIVELVELRGKLSRKIFLKQKQLNNGNKKQIR